MPFRIKITLVALGVIAAVIVIGPLLVPAPPLADTVRPADLAYADSVFVDLQIAGGNVVRTHVQTYPEGLAPPDVIDADGGPGTAFVFLHGFGSQTMTWRHLLPRLGEHGVAGEPVLALALDRPGFGLTERQVGGAWPRGGNPYTPEAQVDLALALLDAYGVERAVVVGHSAGGAVALGLALAHPERVAGLVLVSPAVVRGGGAPAWTRPLLFTPQMERVGPLLMRQLGGQSGEDFLRAAYADPSRLDPVDVDAYRRAVGTTDWDRALWELVKASREPRLLARLGEVEVPVLVLSGVEDAIVPLEESERVAAALPLATLERLPGCGHVAHEECPATTVELVLRWLELEVRPREGRREAGARLAP